MLCSCGASYHVQRAKFHLLKAESLGAKIDRDTVYKNLITKSHKEHVLVQYKDSNFIHDTIKTETVRWKSKTLIDTLTHTVYQDVECKPDTIRVPMSITNNISSKGYTLFQIIMYCLAALSVGYIIRAISK